MINPGPNLIVDIEAIEVLPEVAVIEPPPPPPVDEIVTAPFEPVVIVTLDPATKYELPSSRWVREPEKAGAVTVPLKVDPVRVATIELSIENTPAVRSNPVPAVYNVSSS
jgi:hypothetical protein